MSEVLLTPPATPRRIPSATRPATRQEVADRLAGGASKAEIARDLGITKATVSYHVRRLGAPVDLRCARRYEWSRVQEYYSEGHTLAQCQEQFGFSRQSWFAAVNRGALQPRPASMAIEDLCVAGTLRNRRNLKSRLLTAGLMKGRCEECGLNAWLGRPLSLQIHHRNGIRDDNRLANLALLCPNCHSQTPNFSGRGRRRPDPRREPEVRPDPAPGASTNIGRRAA